MSTVVITHPAFQRRREKLADELLLEAVVKDPQSIARLAVHHAKQLHREGKTPDEIAVIIAEVAREIGLDVSWIVEAILEPALVGEALR